MLTLKTIDTRLYVVDTEADLIPGQQALNTLRNIVYPIIEEDLMRLAEDEHRETFNHLILGECSLAQAIKVLQEKEADILPEQGAYEHGYNHGFKSCLSTHPLTESEIRDYPQWIRVYYAPNTGSNDWHNQAGHNKTKEDLLFLYKSHCFLSRLDGKECEIQMEDGFPETVEQVQEYERTNVLPKTSPFLESGKVVVTKIKN